MRMERPLQNPFFWQNLDLISHKIFIVGDNSIFPIMSKRRKNTIYIITFQQNFEKKAARRHHLSVNKKIVKKYWILKIFSWFTFFKICILDFRDHEIRKFKGLFLLDHFIHGLASSSKNQI